MGKTAKKSAAPTKKSAAPAKKSAAPAKKSAAPAKKSAAPAKKSAAPAKKSAAPTKNPTAPAKNAAPAEVEKAAPPPKKPPVKRMSVVLTKVKPPAAEFSNNDKNFAFQFAESVKTAQEKAARGGEKDHRIVLEERPTSRTEDSASLKFPEADLAQFRRALIELREQIAGKTATLKTVALEQTIDRVGEDEDGSDSFMWLQNLGQVDEQNRVIQKIDEALHRIEDGTYGICEVCGQLIRKPRLLNLPFVHTCMECQTEMESRNGRD